MWCQIKRQIANCFHFYQKSGKKNNDFYAHCKKKWAWDYAGFGVISIDVKWDFKC